MEIPSPPLSHNDDNVENDTNMNMVADYLSPMAFIGLDTVSWPQQPTSSMDADVGLREISFGALDESGFSYDFTFGGDFLGLPSPPSSNTSYDPPSPTNGLIGMMQVTVDPAVTSTSHPASVSVDGSAFTDLNTSAGSKRSHKGDGPRPKTSHTTIERRYRNNLNTRMTGLRQAVPALRILDKNIPTPSGVIDVVDERGYVDGVKAAKKNSKSTILGKATEYIM
jgi:hypothetical protein